jgi:hypothetical protein
MLNLRISIPIILLFLIILHIAYILKLWFFVNIYMNVVNKKWRRTFRGVSCNKIYYIYILKNNHKTPPKKFGATFYSLELSRYIGFYKNVYVGVCSKTYYLFISIEINCKF